MMLKMLIAIVSICLRFLRLITQSREELILENLALRQQLVVLKQKHPRPQLSWRDRIFWVCLRLLWSKWSEALMIVKPETVVSWHRQGFRLYWRWKSSSGRKRGRPLTTSEIRELIGRMARENPTWGAPRIHGELLELGFNISERTVSRYLNKRMPDQDKAQSWLTFLHNHREAIAAIHERLGESEVFGHRAGAFVGADRAKPGLLQLAAGGVHLPGWGWRSLREL